jgi:hypothetical protein
MPLSPNRRATRRLGMMFAIVSSTLPGAAIAGPWEVGGTSPGSRYKIGTEVSWNHTGSKDTWGRPMIKFEAPVSAEMSVEVGGGYGVIEMADGSTRSGARDPSATLKWRLAHERDGRPEMMVEPKLTLAAGDARSGVGGRYSTLKAPLRAGWGIGKYRLTGEMAYTHGFGRDYADTLGYGALLEYFPDERWVFGADIYNDHPVHNRGRRHLRAEAALKFKPTRDLEFQALLGRSVQNRRGEPATTAKLTFEFKFD